MAYSPQLRKQRSCSCPCPPIDVAAWCSSRRSGRHFTRGFDNEDDYYSDEEFDMGAGYPSTASRPATMRWREIWRKIVREKRRIFDAGAPVHGPYDPFSYAQNFDEGEAWVEPENLSRSFSARFAAPPPVLRRVSKG